MLTVGDWSDVLHVLITFLGEAVCLLPSQDLVEAVLEVRNCHFYTISTIVFVLKLYFVKVTFIFYVSFLG